MATPSGPVARRAAGSRPLVDTHRRSAAPSPVTQSKSTAIPRSSSPSHGGPPAARISHRRVARAEQPGHGRAFESETGPRPRVGRLVDDRVGEPAGPVDDRRRPVAQRDHLALATRLEARRHREEVGAGVDPPGHRPVEPLDERDLTGMVARRSPGTGRPGSDGRCPGRRAAPHARAGSARHPPAGRTPSADRADRSSR